MLICCTKNQSLIFVPRHRNTSYQHHNFHTTGINALRLELVQAETCKDIEQIVLLDFIHRLVSQKIEE
jgi:hypothetical protein